MDPSGSNHSISYASQSIHFFAVYSSGSTSLISEGDLHMTGLLLGATSLSYLKCDRGCLLDTISSPTELSINGTLYPAQW